MDILRLALNVTENNGGMENHIRNLTLQQQEIGKSVLVIKQKGDDITENDITVLRNHKIAIGRPVSASVIIFMLASIIAIIKKNIIADVVHVHGDWSIAIFAPILKRIVRGRLSVLSFHGSIQNTISHKYLLPFALKFIDVLIVNGHDSYIYLKKYHARSYFQPSGIKSMFFKDPNLNIGKVERINNVITVANLHPVKGLYRILDVAKLCPGINFSIIGDGPLRDVLKERIESIGTKNITLLGSMSPKEVVKELEKASVYLSLSIEEGTPTSILEAMSMSLPIVCTNAGGIKHIFNLNKKYVLDDYKAEAVAEMVRTLCENDTLRSQIGIDNKKLSAQFDWPTVSRRITSIYSCACNIK